MASGKKKMRRTLFTHQVGKVVDFVVKDDHLFSGCPIKFSSEHEFRKTASNYPGKRLVEIWNQLPGVKPVGRFTDRNTAMRRIWAVVQASSRSKEFAAKNPRGATKAERVVALLKAPPGASLGAIMQLTGWQSHSVRGFISAQLAKRMGLKIQSFKRDGERIYRIRS
jgi:Protein of unknown function (DUF3489)